LEFVGGEGYWKKKEKKRRRRLLFLIYFEKKKKEGKGEPHISELGKGGTDFVRLSKKRGTWEKLLYTTEEKKPLLLKRKKSSHGMEGSRQIRKPRFSRRKKKEGEL